MNLLKQKHKEQQLANVLKLIHQRDNDYEVRYQLVLMALGQAASLGYPCGIRFDPSSTTEWPVVFIELPTGQVSWHLKQHGVEWDGHSTVEKYKRIDAYAELIQPTKQEMAEMQGEPWV